MNDQMKRADKALKRYKDLQTLYFKLRSSSLPAAASNYVLTIIDYVDDVLDRMDNFNSEYSKMIKLHYLNGMKKKDVAIQCNKSYSTYYRENQKALKTFSNLMPSEIIDVIINFKILN